MRFSLHSQEEAETQQELELEKNKQCVSFSITFQQLTLAFRVAQIFSFKLKSLNILIRTKYSWHRSTKG